MVFQSPCWRNSCRRNCCGSSSTSSRSREGTATRSYQRFGPLGIAVLELVNCLPPAGPAFWRFNLSMVESSKYWTICWLRSSTVRFRHAASLARTQGYRPSSPTTQPSSDLSLGFLFLFWRQLFYLCLLPSHILSIHQRRIGDTVRHR